MLLVVAIMGGVIYNTGVTEKCKADGVQVKEQEKFTYDDKKCVDKKKGCTEKNYWTGHIEITVDK